MASQYQKSLGLFVSTARKKFSDPLVTQQHLVDKFQRYRTSKSAISKFENGKPDSFDFDFFKELTLLLLQDRAFRPLRRSNEWEQLPYYHLHLFRHQLTTISQFTDWRSYRRYLARQSNDFPNYRDMMRQGMQYRLMSDLPELEHWSLLEGICGQVLDQLIRAIRRRENLCVYLPKQSLLAQHLLEQVLYDTWIYKHFGSRILIANYAALEAVEYERPKISFWSAWAEQLEVQVLNLSEFNLSNKLRFALLDENVFFMLNQCPSADAYYRLTQISKLAKRSHALVVTSNKRTAAALHRRFGFQVNTEFHYLAQSPETNTTANTRLLPGKLLVRRTPRRRLFRRSNLAIDLT